MNMPYRTRIISSGSGKTRNRSPYKGYFGSTLKKSGGSDEKSPNVVVSGEVPDVGTAQKPGF
jgi:hypothetical protein